MDQISGYFVSQLLHNAIISVGVFLLLSDLAKT